MADYRYSDSEMNNVIGCTSDVERVLTQVREAVAQAVATLRSVKSAGGDLGAAIDGTVMGNVQSALNMSDNSLNKLSRMKGRFIEAQQVLRHAGANVSVETVAPWSEHSTVREGTTTSSANTTGILD